MIFLTVRQGSWQEKHESVTYVKSSRLLTELKCNPDFVWLKSYRTRNQSGGIRIIDGNISSQESA